MKILEIKNNLVKLSYNANEDIRLAIFVALIEESKSYVAQIINLKADAISNYAIAKLIFTFNKAGLVDIYDGSIPSVNAKISMIDAQDILKLLPLERPVIIGKLAQQDCVLKLDATMFENHLTVCAEKFEHISLTVKNAVSQINLKDEKIIVIDTDHNFTEYEPIKFKKDFKLPLNYDLINFIYDNDLVEIEPTSKAVIQEIFFSVQEYAKTTENGFIPFKTFVDVVNQQYQQTDMPELALLKNKLLKYEEENIFAQTKEEFEALKTALNSHSIIYVDISDVIPELQRELISYINNVADEFEAYIYSFVKLTNHNSDKKLLKSLLDNEHIFTTIICSHGYKYVSELKQRSNNLILFAPQTVQHDFASYNTLLNKLNANEFIIYGELTQNVPFVVELVDLEEENFVEDNLPETTLIETEIGSENQSYDLTHTSDDFVQNVVDDNFEMAEEEPSFIEETEQEETLADIVFDDLDENYENFTANEEQQFADDGIFEADSGVYNVEQDFVEQPEDNNQISDEDFSYQFETPEETLSAPLENDQYNVEEEEALDSFDTGENNTDLTGEDLDFFEEQAFNNEAQTEDNTQQNEGIVQNPPFFPEASENEQEDEFSISDESANLNSANTYEEFSDLGEYNDDEDLPIYASEDVTSDTNNPQFTQGDTVVHPKHGKGIIEKIIKYGNKTICSIVFEEGGKRFLDPAISELQKLS